MEEIINLLKEKNYTISTMESCTGGAVANAITNIEGASEVLKFSAVTYSNEYKIKMGVDENIINEYSVYSKETARSMSKTISSFANSDIGVGITGKINKPDPNNPYGEDNIVYISIYNRRNNKYYDKKLKVTKKTRSENKELIIEKIIATLKPILK